MNYRHGYHAGNFADVVKHAVLSLVIDYMKRKDAPFRVIDTHAGRGRYELASAEANKTQEWRDGIGRLLGPAAKPIPPDLSSALKVYLDAVRAENAPGELLLYPGSPRIALRLMRPQDTLVANEAHPEEYEKLKSNLGGVRGSETRILALDGWMALRSLLPPKERRGVILIDPPFEERSELHRLAGGLREGLARFASGIFLAWYPIKDQKIGRRLCRALGATATRKLLRLELLVREPRNPELFNGCGLIIANPPFILECQLKQVGTGLARQLAVADGAHCALRWLDAG